MTDKRYYIEIHYKTGDSESTNEYRNSISLTWNNLDIAKENLQRIKEHYIWYDNKYGWDPDKGKEKKPDFVHDKHDGVLFLLTDDKEDFQMSSYWTGHFEDLFSATIKENMDPGLYFVTERGKFR